MMLYSRQNPVDHEMEIKPTKQVIDEVLEMIKPALTSAFHLHAVIDCERDIQIDSIGLHQILTNLMVNARDAMRGIGGDIEVSLKIVTTHELLCSACSHNLEGHYIELRVTDSGTGIEDSVIQNIFDPFFTTKPAGEGTGLGLSTVSGMVHDAQGHIIVESKTTEPNQGTAFRLLFPTLGNLP
jgi:signal transduction histidine kinase